MPFDPEAFERLVELKATAHPELRGLLEVTLAAEVALGAAGLILLVKAILARDRASPPLGPLEPARFGPSDLALFLSASVLLLVGMAAVVPRRVIEAAGAPAILLQEGFFLAAIGVALAIAARAGQGLRALGVVRAPDGNAAATGLRFFVIAFPLSQAASYLTKLAFHALGRPVTPNHAVGTFLTTDSRLELAVTAAAAVLAAPLLEEVVFRGFIFSSLRVRLGPRLAMMLSAALFALMHPLADAPSIFILGCAFTLALERARSLHASIAAHVLNNALGIGVLFLDRTVARAP